jgi:hypothetical protein
MLKSTQLFLTIQIHAFLVLCVVNCKKGPDCSRPILVSLETENFVLIGINHDISKIFSLSLSQAGFSAKAVTSTV